MLQCLFPLNRVYFSVLIWWISLEHAVTNKACSVILFLPWLRQHCKHKRFSNSTTCWKRSGSPLQSSQNIAILPRCAMTYHTRCYYLPVKPPAYSVVMSWHITLMEELSVWEEGSSAGPVVCTLSTFPKPRNVGAPHAPGLSFKPLCNISVHITFFLFSLLSLLLHKETVRCSYWYCLLKAHHYFFLHTKIPIFSFKGTDCCISCSDTVNWQCHRSATPFSSIWHSAGGDFRPWHIVC